MNVAHFPWVELAIITPLIGALLCSRCREPIFAYRCGLAFTGLTFFWSFLTWLNFYLFGAVSGAAWSLQQHFFERRFLEIDELNAPLVPAVALLHFLTAVATARTKMRRFSFTWSLATESILLAKFSAREPWALIALLSLGTLPPLIELINRGRPTRVYVLHMLLFVGLLVTGWAAVESTSAQGEAAAWATVVLMAAVLVRCGTAPAHCWVTDWFEHASFGIALLYVVPLGGVYAAIRLVVPIAPDWVLHGIGVMSAATAVYAAGMAVVQREARRFFAYLFISHGSLVLIGLELSTPISLTGALCLWFSVILSLGGFGLTLRALEARLGRLSLGEFHGLYEHMPSLAACFLLTGLASVGFPFTLGFVSTELLVDGAITANLWVGVATIIAAALNGVAVVRAYLLLFTGGRHISTVSLASGRRERFAMLTLAALILGGGIFPQPGVESRHRAAKDILKHRHAQQLQEIPAVDNLH